MIHRRIARLNLTPAEAEAYVPPAGINVIWLEFFPDKSQVIAEFVSSDLEPDPILRKSATDIRHELGYTFRNRVLEDNLGHHPLSPKKGMMVEINLDSPLIQEAPQEIKRAADEATDIHEVETTKEVADSARVESTGRKIFAQPKEVRQHKVLRQRGPDQKLVQEVEGPEHYVYQLGVIDIG